ncbi:MAG: hypothetical protein E5W81_05155 [Mesorhizobium sp.]|nr:MAG: hypothetical protein E5V36_20230 [Mesorhizobium sp.]TKB95290.1 MAG: hypothetical protein E5W81_05155 [Mesorhizobium sp.]
MKMRYIHFRFIFFIVAVLFCTAVGFAGKNSTKIEQGAISTFNEYASAWKSRDIKRVWKLMSPKLRKGNENSIEKFNAFVKSNGFYPSNFSIRRVVLNGNEASITADVTYSDFSGKKMGTDLEESIFVLIGGNWYFDRYSHK